MNDIVGNDRQAALLRLEEKAELAFEAWSQGDMPDDLYELRMSQIVEQKARILRDLRLLSEGNEDGSNRDVPPFDNDPRTDAAIKQEVYDRLSDPDYDDDHPDDWEE